MSALTHRRENAGTGARVDMGTGSNSVFRSRDIRILSQTEYDSYSSPSPPANVSPYSSPEDAWDTVDPRKKQRSSIQKYAGATLSREDHASNISVFRSKS